MYACHGTTVRAAVAAALLFATACIEPINTKSTEWVVVIEPTSVLLTPGQESALGAQVRDGAGAIVPGVSVTWQSLDADIATISQSGVVRGVAVGATMVRATATDAQGSGDGLGKLASSTATVTVTAVAAELATTVAVAPSSASVAIGSTTQLTATARDRNNTLLTDRQTVWTSSDNSVATVSTSGRVSAVNAGTATITARVDTARGTSTITVQSTPPPPPAPVASVAVAPSSATINAGATAQLSATLRDASNNVLTGRSVAWTTSNDAVATVSGSGLVTGVAAGSATITATSEGKSGSASITVAAVQPPPPGGDPVIIAAGDIASCDSDGDEATALLLDNMPGTIITLGDNVYNDGLLEEFMDCYEPSWGRHKARTKPVNGNHETYGTSDMAGYFDYFGAAAGERGKAYYSFNIGEWHLIAINNMIDVGPNSTQVNWLKADLAANPKACTLAYWHYPLFSSGDHGNQTKMRAIWDVLYAHNVDVVLTGHDHHYERFAKQTPAAVADPVRGIRQWVVGTGGASDYSVGSPEPNSEVRHTGTFGVLKMTLHATSYSWEFVPIAGKTFTDTGTTNCH
jgi:uncharacterized protein YjdB